MIAALSSRIAWGNALSPPGVIRSVVLSFLLPLVAALALSACVLNPQDRVVGTGGTV